MSTSVVESAETVQPLESLFKLQEKGESHVTLVVNSGCGPCSGDGETWMFETSITIDGITAGFLWFPDN